MRIIPKNTLRPAKTQTEKNKNKLHNPQAPPLLLINTSTDAIRRTVSVEKWRAIFPQRFSTLPASVRANFTAKIFLPICSHQTRSPQYVWSIRAAIIYGSQIPGPGPYIKPCRGWSRGPRGTEASGASRGGKETRMGLGGLSACISRRTCGV